MEEELEICKVCSGMGKIRKENKFCEECLLSIAFYCIVLPTLVFIGLIIGLILAPIIFTILKKGLNFYFLGIILYALIGIILCYMIYSIDSINFFKRIENKKARIVLITLIVILNIVLGLLFCKKDGIFTVLGYIHFMVLLIPFFGLLAFKLFEKSFDDMIYFEECNLCKGKKIVSKCKYKEFIDSKQYKEIFKNK